MTDTLNLYWVSALVFGGIAICALLGARQSHASFVDKAPALLKELKAQLETTLENTGGGDAAKKLVLRFDPDAVIEQVFGAAKACGMALSAVAVVALISLAIVWCALAKIARSPKEDSVKVSSTIAEDQTSRSKTQVPRVSPLK